MKYTLCLLAILIGCSESGGDSEVQKQGNPLGLALFGLMSPNAVVVIDKFIEVQQASSYPATSILWASFGKDLRWVDKYLDALGGQDNVMQIHFSNEVGRKNGRLGPSDIMPYSGIAAYNSHLEQMTEETEHLLAARALEILEFRERYPKSTRWILSLGLESQYTKEAALNLLNLLTDVWHYEISYNPLDGDCSYMPDWVYCETHGLNTIAKHSRCIISADGWDSGPEAVISAGNQPGTVQEVRDFIKRGIDSNCITLLWSAQTQGIDRSFTPTLNRTFRLSDPTALYLIERIAEADPINLIEGN